MIRLAALVVAVAVTSGVAGAPSANARRVEIVANGDGFQPSSVTLKKGEATTLVFTRTTDETCARAVVFPELGIKKDLPLKQAVAIDVPVDKAGTFAFQCGMGMYKSKVVIQ